MQWLDNDWGHLDVFCLYKYWILQIISLQERAKGYKRITATLKPQRNVVNDSVLKHSN